MTAESLSRSEYSVESNDSTKNSDCTEIRVRPNRELFPKSPRKLSPDLRHKCSKDKFKNHRRPIWPPFRNKPKENRLRSAIVKAKNGKNRDAKPNSHKIHRRLPTTNADIIRTSRNRFSAALIEKLQIHCRSTVFQNQKPEPSARHVFRNRSRSTTKSSSVWALKPIRVSAAYAISRRTKIVA